MKKTNLLFLFQAIFAFTSCLAQSNRADVYLTNYTIPKEHEAIGFVRVKQGEIKSLALNGPLAATFKIGKDFLLSVRTKKLDKNVNTFDVTMTVVTTSGQTTSATFKIVRDTFIHNKVIAHRGAWKNTGSPENSIAALNHAVTLGCEGSEFDVHMSADSIPVINHDPAIQGMSIVNTKSTELRALKLTNGELMPTLEEYLKAGMNQTRTKLILEIKPSELGKEHSLALTRKVVNLVQALHAEAWVDYISFDYDVCLEVMRLAPYAKAAYLRGDKSPDELAKDKFFGLDYNLSVLQKNPDWVKEAQSKKLTVNVWTVNDGEMLKEMLKQNVDFITTNEPELLLSMVKQ